MRMKTSLVQFARVSEETKENVKRMVGLLRKIGQTNIVCLPENWVGRFVLDEEEGKALISTLSKIASEKNFNLLTGGAYMRRGEGVFGSCYLIDRKGEVRGVCDKIFPSKSMGEREFLSPGRVAGFFDVDGFKIGVVICVDAVYPEICRHLASKGAEVLFNPSNIPENRLEMWRDIGVTRAVENGVYFIFLNNTSTHYLDGRKITGHSFVASPSGEIMVEADEREQIIELELDLDQIASVRSRWPFLEDTLKRKPFLE